jgi:tyrosyl-tRNA synthetase
MARDLTPEEKVALIKLNLQEVLRPDILDEVIIKEKRPLVIYWGLGFSFGPLRAH